MRIHTYLLALAPFALAGCVIHEPVPVTTTTQVTREVTTTTGPGTVPVTREVIVTQAPPPVRIETRTVSPGPGYVWANGRWRWTGANYQWVAGNWVSRPRAAAVWVEGHWLRRGGGWVWVDGRWQ